MDSYTTLDIFVADPKAGVRAVIKKISLFLAADMKDSLKENVIKILNNQKDKYYPDVGGILLGYSNVKIAKDTEWDYQNDFLSVYIRAKFYIFQPTIGSELRCVVEEVCSSKRTLKCLAHGKFEVNVNIQGEAAKNVVKGELITAKILRVSLRADMPIFLFGDYISNHDPVVQIVDLLDDDSSDEQSNQTQVPPVQVSNNKRSHEQEVKSNHSSPVKKKQREDTGSMQPAPAGPSSEATPKSPLLDTPSSYLSTLSPTSRSDSNSPSPKKKPLSFLSEQVTQSSSTTAEKEATTVVDSQQPKKVRLSSDSPSKKMDKEPEPAANKRPKKTLTSDSNKTPSPGKNSSKTELSDASSVSGISNATSTSEVSLKSKNKKLEPPEGFKMLSRTKSGKVRLQAPDGKILLSYRAAWDHYYSLKENDEKKKSTKVLEGESVAKGKDKEGKADNSSNTSSSTKDTSKIVESKSSESSNEASSSQPKTSTQKTKSNITIENASNEKESAKKRTPNDPRGKENDMNSIRAVFSTEESDSSYESTSAPDLEKLGILKPKKDDSSSSESDSSASDTVDDKGVQSSKKKVLTKKSPSREESSSDDSDDDDDPPPLKRKSTDEKDKMSLKSKSAPTQKMKESTKEKAKVAPSKVKAAVESSSSDDSDNDDLPPLNGKPHKKKDLPKVSNTEPISKSNDVNKEAGTKKSDETSSKPVNAKKNGNVNESSDFGDDSKTKSVTTEKDNSRPSTSIKEIKSSNSKSANPKASGDESDSESSSGSSIEDGNLSQAKSLSSSSSKPSSSKALSSKDDKVSNANKPTKELQSKPTNKEDKNNLQNESESSSSSSEDDSESESDTASDMSSYTVSKKPLKSKISKSKVNSNEDDGLKSPIKKDKNKIEATAKIFSKSIENEDTKNKKSEDLKDKNNDLKDSGSKVKTPKKLENRATSNLKTPKKDKSPSKAQSPMVKWLNGHDNAKNKKPDNVENKKSPHLSSTVMTDKNNKPQVQLPDGISPILKTKRKSTSMANTSLPYYDQIMKGKVEEKAKDKSNKSEEKKPTSHNENKEKSKKKNKAKTAGFL